jgi:hypothetical protein
MNGRSAPSSVGRTGTFEARFDASGLVFGNLDRNDIPGHFISNSNALLRFAGAGNRCLPSAEMICSSMKISVRINDPARDGSCIFRERYAARRQCQAGRSGWSWGQIVSRQQALLGG